MKRFLFSVAIYIFVFNASAQLPAADRVAAKGEIKIQPITHASLVLSYHNKHIYVDPTGGAEAYKGLPSPDLILITDIHGDHLDVKTLEAIIKPNVTLIVPQAVADMLPASIDKKKVVVLKNDEETKQLGIEIEAVPMYNLPETADSRHPKGRGNGYIVELGDKEIYISGDTEDIKEMRNLDDVDIAFVCMNLPYTMDVNQAASAVLDFKPKIVYPYHHRGQDINEFKRLVDAGNKNIEVRLLNWYPEKK